MLCPSAPSLPAVNAEPAYRAGHQAEVQALNAKNRERIRSQGRQARSKRKPGKPAAQPTTLAVGSIVSYQPRRMGTTTVGLASKKVTCKVVGIKGRGALKEYKLRSNAGVLQTAPYAKDLELAVPDTAATINFDGVETEGVPTVSETALARRGLGKSCKCRKQCGPRCPCKNKCSRKCGCKCKVGANCGNH